MKKFLSMLLVVQIIISSFAFCNVSVFAATCEKHSYKQISIIKASNSSNGKINYKCTKCKATKSKTINKAKSITLSKTEYVFDNKAKKPSVTVKDVKGNKISSDNYTVVYAKGRKNVGTYKVTIKFKGSKYQGSLTKTFKICPTPTTITSVSSKTNSVTVKWNKKSNQVSGYQVRYSKSSSMKNAKTITISKNTTTSKTINSLSGNTKYYVQVRTYYISNGTKYYSKWSEKKTKSTTKSSTSSSTPAPTSDWVYISETGSCYHKNSSCSNGNYTKTSLKNAQNLGLRACKKCY